MVVPVVTSVSPQSATTFGNVTVTVVGTGFVVGASEVFFGDLLATNIVVASATSLSCTAPPLEHVDGVYVTVVTAGGISQSNAASLFYYLSALPAPTYTITNIFFDPLANYTFYGNVNFARAPITPSGGGGGSFAWLLGGNSNSTGSSSYLGTSNAQDLFIKTNDIIVAQITSGQDVIWANIVDYQINSSATFLVDSAAVSIASTSLSLQSSGAVTLATSAATSLTIGFSSLSITMNCDLLNIAGTTGISFNAPGISIGNSIASFITIGNPGSDTTFDATLLKLPNMPAAVGGEKIVMIDTVTGQLRISP